MSQNWPIFLSNSVTSSSELKNKEPSERQLKPERLLVLLTGTNIGATLLTLPAILALQRNGGSAAETWFLYRQDGSCPPPALDILRTMSGIVGFIPWPQRSSWLVIAHLWLRIWRLQFDRVALCDPRRLNPLKLRRYRLFFKAAGIRQLTGFQLDPMDTPSNTKLQPQIARIHLEHVARDGIDIARESDFSTAQFKLPDAVRSTATVWLQSRRRYASRPLVALCPGARSAANLWGLDRFTELGHRIIELDRYELIVVGGPAESILAENLLGAWSHGINATGVLSLLESAAILEASAFLIGLDTGTTHLAAALKTPCIMLQGGRAYPGNWDPIGLGHIVLRYPVACTGCGLSRCPLSRHPCMRGITVDHAWQAVLAMHQRICPTLEHS